MEPDTTWRGAVALVVLPHDLMPDGEYTVAELGRMFLDFRTEIREEVKWLRRLLIGALCTAVIASIASSIFAGTFK